jgi:peptide/nickel transport system substrate-binding protein
MRRLLMMLLLCLFGAAGAFGKSPADTFIFADYGTVRSLDPAVAYDNVSQQRVLNIYESLIFFDGNATDKFVPVLATRVPSVENGGVSQDGKTYRFKIRKGVKFHNGATLEPEDVVYSVKRHMIVDQDGGPMWMMLEALTGKGATRDEKGKIIPAIFDKIDRCVEEKGDEVIFHLIKPYPPFLGIIANYGSLIIDKAWAIKNGCWNGDIADAAKYNNPPMGKEPLQNKANGTGAYQMASWEPSKEFVFTRFDDYWGEKGTLKRAVMRYVKEWSTRKLMLQNGDVDKAMVDAQYAPEVENMKGVKIYKVPQLSVSAALFCRKINPAGNPNIGSGKLDGEGIPPDFFTDIHVRRAFMHAFDRDTYKEDVFNNLVIMPTSPSARGLPYHKDVPVYAFDLDKAAAEMKQAFGGKVWEKGFKMVINHNTGNELREAAAHMLAENIMALNPKFQIEVRNVEWKDYLIQYREYKYPVFIIGWGADYPDPHNFLYTFMHSEGVYGRYMAYKNRKADRLLKAGINTIIADERKKIYRRLQQIWHEDAPGIMIYQQIAVLTYRDNISGVMENPMFNDPWDYLKKLRKAP